MTVRTGTTGATGRTPEGPRALPFVHNGRCTRQCGLSPEVLGPALDAAVTAAFSSGARAESVIELLAEHGMKRARSSVYAHRQRHLSVRTADDIAAEEAAEDLPTDDISIVNRLIGIGSRSITKSTRVSVDQTIKLLELRARLGGADPLAHFTAAINAAFETEAVSDEETAQEGDTK